MVDQLLAFVPDVALKFTQTPLDKLVVYCKLTPGRPSHVMGSVLPVGSPMARLPKEASTAAPLVRLAPNVSTGSVYAPVARI